MTGTQAACGVSGFRWSGLRKHSAVIGAPGTLRGFGGVGFQEVGFQKAQRCDGCAGPMACSAIDAHVLWPALRLVRRFRVQVTGSNRHSLGRLGVDLGRFGSIWVDSGSILGRFWVDSGSIRSKMIRKPELPGRNERIHEIRHCVIARAHQ